MDKNDFYNTSVSEDTLKDRNNMIQERWKELNDFYLKHSDETIKYLFYVNAGGTGTVIGFMGSSEVIREMILLRIALCCFAFGLVCVGILRVFLLHKISFLFDNWRRDSNKYWKNEIGYSELSDKDDERSESDFFAFLIGYISAISFIIGLILGGISLFTFNQVVDKGISGVILYL
jgi:hypothetical protein